MKGKKLKNIILSLIVFPGLFVASFEATHLFLMKNQPISSSHLPLSSNKNILAVANEPSVSTVKEDEQYIYNILGSSNKLSEKAQSDMANWREKIVNLVKKNKNTVYINGFTKEKTVCLTFDDGPDGIITPKVLDTLKAYNIKGSFFFIGKNVVAYPSVVKRTFDEDNLVLSHSYTHERFSILTDENVKRELSLTENAIYSLIGERPAIIRPPYGDISQKTLNILNNQNYTTVLWSIDTLDWAQKDKNNISKNVIDNIRPGDIILMHCNEDKIASLDALPLIIKGLQKKGYKFLDLSQMLNMEAYK